MSNNPHAAMSVDRYLTELFVPRDDTLTEALREADAAGMPSIHVSPTQGVFLHLLARIRGARRVLEVGTLVGYSTIWLARAVAAPPEGLVLSLEIDPARAAMARANVDRAGIGDRVEIRVAPAAESLADLEREAAAGSLAPFDLVFIDADKPNNPRYVEAALRLTAPGSVIVLDNVVRDGRVADEQSEDPAIRGTRTALSILANDPRVQATALQTVGGKGYDGFAVALVVGRADATRS